MKLKFESNLEYQLDAIRAVTDLFEGMTPNRSEFEVSRNVPVAVSESEIIDESDGKDAPLRYLIQCEQNPILPDDDTILANLKRIQEENDIPISSTLIDPQSPYPQTPNFSVEMETGTGKTYVYLRTIFELNKLYGFRKFIIVVPSVAIREGVLSSIRLMREHFQMLYNKVPFSHFVYDSKDLSKVRQFAMDGTIQLMIINIDAFNKDDNIINNPQERTGGYKPIHFIQGTRPVVIIDEPQSVDTTPKSQDAIKLLKPLVTLRYSATHINPFNLLYRLDPIKAYDMRLVKQIEVASIKVEDDFNRPYIKLDRIGYSGNSRSPHAEVLVHKQMQTGPKIKKVQLKKKGNDLKELTGRDDYEGYVVNEITAEEGNEHVSFTNGVTLYVGMEQGGNQNELLKSQIRLTVEEHFKKEKRYQPLGIKVLSLFFVDKVANYRRYDESGNKIPGIFAEWFEEAYNEFAQKPAYKGVMTFSAENVHDGYFSEDKKRYVDTTGSTKDDDTYNRIMKAKETLLSDDPLRFIFSHSALKEGWDNPNVFQICMLREMTSTRARRQTLGRGLRLPVDKTGHRVHDESINRLTVIADEPFEAYVRGLQADMENECNIKFGRLEKIVFASIENRATGGKIGQATSEAIWNALKDKGYINQDGDLTDQFMPDEKGFKLELLPEYEPLQMEIQDTMKRYLFKDRIKNSRDRKKLNYNKRIELNADFQELWHRISRKTRYFVEFDTDVLVKDAVKRIKDMPKISPPGRQHWIKHKVGLYQAGVGSDGIIDQKNYDPKTLPSLPDIIAFLQHETGLTRHTLLEILKKSERIEEFLLNPQAFLTETTKCINRALAAMIVDGIKYERIEGQQYEMRLFESEEIETYLTRLYEVRSREKTPYDYILYDSTKEKEIAERLDSNESVRFFCKLPQWFIVPTPLGTYNPDWALVMENDGKLYLVRETKGTLEQEKRRELENRKIKCGKAHFDALGVGFKDAVDIADVLG
ncbi:MAG: DEAD/DEAH box helicase family protein [Planctomycetaceae bacterium]|nr:DEAD/DEAH box helicase family protein [Planctomycetaceae bacterium]